MSNEEKEKKKKKKEQKAQRLREKQEQHLKKVNEEELKQKEKSEKDLIPDEVTKKGYKIDNKELTSGQFSTVLAAKLDDEDIAAKIIEKNDKEKAFLTKLLPRLVIILRALDERHPNIIDILDVFETSKRVIVMMRLTPNGSLNDFMDKRSELVDESQTRKWAQQLIAGLTYLHINGIVHRDLRTDRIFLDQNNCLKISGFTYSRLWMNPKDKSIALSKTCGTTGPYCSPEALAGESYDPRTADVWAVGVIIFFIWNKTFPFDYNLTHKLVAQQKSNEWINRMRQESNEDIKEFFKQIFNVDHNQRKAIVDLIRDKWLDCKVQVIVESNEPKNVQKAEESENKSSNAKKSKESTEKQSNAESAENKGSTNDGKSNRDDKMSDKSEDKPSKAKDSKNDDKKSSDNTESKPKDEKAAESEEAKDGKKPSDSKELKSEDKASPKDKEPKSGDKNDTKEKKKEEKESEDSDDDTSIVIDDDDDDDELKKIKSEDKTDEKREEKKSEPKGEVKATEKKSEKKSVTGKSDQSVDVLKADILAQLMREFMQIADK